MSGTSVKIFGNDMAMDVKADFDALYGIGKYLDEIHEYIFSYQPDDDDEDACAYWSALALIEWEYGILEENIKDKAISIIKNHNDYYLYDNAKNQKARQEELAKLVTILSKSNESPRKPKKTYIYRCPYKVGDILALPIKNKYVYLHISSITRKKKKIKELEKDDMCVKVFDKVSDSLLTIDKFKTNVLNRNQYMNLYKWKQCDTKWLWCVGIREQKALERKLIVIGNAPVEEKDTTDSISADFQFKVIETTLTNLFHL